MIKTTFLIFCLLALQCYSVFSSEQSTGPPTRTTTRRVPCTLLCEEKQGCTSYENYNRCRCDYDCSPTTTPSSLR
ncbi:CLUMA_CG016500, isoform A [Clunio marinus]|uniref:CLUMA_CG016500, isoform A n=1 Tax=Clunio marinus TaxID=568069 RepID=A0A1J1IU51_9DIPT|nr:CLUMA_CG016500, isoform A [Clunio marinus]